MLCAIAEYGMGNEVSTFGDIYSYGILLLEMFTGKRPTDNIFKDDLNLHDFVRGALPEQVINIVDPIILLEREDMETRTNDTHSRSNRMSQNSGVLDFDIWNWSFLFYGISKRKDEH